MKRVAIFPGSFDPVTKGHEDILKRAIPLFDKVIIAVGENANKKYMFTLEQRIAWLEEVFSDQPKIEVSSYDGLTISYAKSKGAAFLIRGLRNPGDFEFEKAIVQANRDMEPEIETVFLLTSVDFSHISSSIVRDVIKHNGKYELFVPDAVRIK